MKHLAALCLLLLLYVNSCFAQAGAKVPAAPTPKEGVTAAPRPAPTKEKDSLMSELDYYKKLSEQAAKSSESANTTTWSALGVVIGAVGFILLANYRLNTSRIKEEVATQGLETQRAILAAVSTQIAADILASQTRVQELERQIREKLDGSVSQVTNRLISLEQELVLRDAKAILQHKSGAYPEIDALRIYLRAAEIKITQPVLDNGFFISGLQFLSAAREFPKEDADKIEAIMAVLKEKASIAYSFWAPIMENAPVYAGGPWKPDYIKNKPTEKAT
jgi:hypothetical protein